MATIETALTRLLGIEHPILLAPMGSAAGGQLAAAVTHAGGLGLIGSGYASTTAIKLSFGDPTPITGRIKEAGSKIICQEQSLAQARQAAQAGADIIIAQGR